MARFLLRLLLIVSLVTNGVAVPWAMAKPADAGGHDHAAMVAHSPMVDMTDCHHGASHGSHGAMDHAAPGSDSPSAPEDRSCCDGANCTCGCMLPPVLARFALSLPVFTWAEAPVAEPTMRAVGRRTVPPFRPPAA